MKKNVYLGLDKTGKYCNILETFLDFDVMSAHCNRLERNDFVVSCTNWNGHDELTRTMELRGWTKLGRKIFLKKPIIFYGSDFDWGNNYPWEFKVYFIIEVK